MTPAEKTAQARSLLDTPLFHALWDEMEAAAINACIYADPKDDEKRGAYAAEARAIRNFRSKLNALVSEANTQRNGAPA
ncbi:hypothetical protein [Rhizobium sp. NZLR11]|uniref:hypothetical protein n=1 Tax=Rhizobium sp. NZLR11 TaxID=2731098 RepID=UPI001C82B715|nr:hypothetical protein [Rhizobium sp. NZLR11]MBX5206697.1 hypothetical protein [Rhizobium sp. NZLR11]